MLEMQSQVSLVGLLVEGGATHIIGQMAQYRAAGIQHHGVKRRLISGTTHKVLRGAHRIREVAVEVYGLSAVAQLDIQIEFVKASTDRVQAAAARG